MGVIATSNSLYADSLHFFRHHIKNIFLLALLVTGIELFFWFLLQPNPSRMLTLLQIDPALLVGDTARNNLLNEKDIDKLMIQLSPQQARELLKEIIKFCLMTFAPILIKYTLLTSGMVSFIKSVVSKQQINIKQIITLMPNTLLLLFISFILTAFFFVFSVKLFFIPAIIFLLATAIAPVILSISRCSIFSAFRQSAQLTFQYKNKLIPIILITALVKIMLYFFMAYCEVILGLGTAVLTLFLYFIGTNLVSSFLIIYFYRFYTSVHADKLI